MISCHLHDYVEIACMYRFRVRLAMKSGEVLDGTAVETIYNSDRQECLVLENGSIRQLVVLEQAKSMQALVDNPHFDSVDFA